MIDKFILFCQHQIAVCHQDLSKLLGFEDINSLKLTLRTKQLLVHTDRQLHIIGVFI